jgi:hypothetical protein
MLPVSPNPSKHDFDHFVKEVFWFDYETSCTGSCVEHLVLDGGAIFWGVHGNFRRWGLAGGIRSLGV